MINSRIASVVGLMSVLAVSGFGSQVTAQGALRIGGTASNFGTRSVAPGFVPDPININITSGGSLDARSMNLVPGCVGFVTANSVFILWMTGNSPSLRVYVTVPGARGVSPTDTTLLVNAGNGSWHCNDDSFGGANPSVDLPSQGAGQYDIWVGSYQAGTQARGVLHITELGSNHP